MEPTITYCIANSSPRFSNNVGNMAESLAKPFLRAPYASDKYLHSPLLLPSQNVELPARGSQLKCLGLTTGSPIKDNSETSQAYRPSRAYGVRSMQGGGRSFVRETAVTVAAGVVAKNLLKHYAGTEILAYVSQVHKVVLPEGLVDHETLTIDQIKSSIIRCPNPEYLEKMIVAIDSARLRGDSIGGVVTCIVRNVPWRRGSPAFHEIEAELAKGVMCLPATEGFEIGCGFRGAFMTGSEYIDEFCMDEDSGQIRTRTNQSGGIQGGVSNQETIKMRIAFKPIATISRWQNTVSGDKHEMELIAGGHHDSCFVPGAVPMVEAMVGQVLLGQLIAERAPCLMSPTNAASPGNP